MNKAELIDAVSAKSGLTKADTDRAFKAFVETVSETMAKGESIVLVGFGTFLVRDRQARSGRNPRTGETISIESAKIPAFKAGKTLKYAVNFRPSNTQRVVSSVGRASPLQGECRGFEPLTTHQFHRAER